MLKWLLSSGRSTIQLYSSPHATPDVDPEPALLKIIMAAKSSVLVGIYSLTLPRVAQALIYKHQAGIPVRVLADAAEAGSKTSLIPQLIAAGVDVRLWGGNYRLMHAKVLVADGRTCVLGSYNFSSLAEQDDIEVMVTADNKALAADLINLIENAYAAGVVPAG